MIFSTLLAQKDLNQLVGTVKPPVGTGLSDPGQGISNLITTGIQLALFVAGILLLVYLLWGAFEWITSAGDPDKIEKARGKITQAIIGIILLFASLAIFVVVAGNILGIITRDAAGNIYFKLPNVGGK